ncbi:hypothetical protein D9M68_978240 [compost metagenome]
MQFGDDVLIGETYFQFLTQLVRTGIPFIFLCLHDLRLKQEIEHVLQRNRRLTRADSRVGHLQTNLLLNRNEGQCRQIDLRQPLPHEGIAHHGQSITPPGKVDKMRSAQCPPLRLVTP